MIFDVEDLLFIFIHIAVRIRARNKRISNSSQSRVIPQIFIHMLIIKKVVFTVYGLRNLDSHVACFNLLKLTMLAIFYKLFTFIRLDIQHIITDFAELHFII
jgi:hypothetical protein